MSHSLDTDVKEGKGRGKNTPKYKHSLEEVVTNKLRGMMLNSEIEASPVLLGREACSRTRGNYLGRSVSRRRYNRIKVSGP